MILLANEKITGTVNYFENDIEKQAISIEDQEGNVRTEVIIIGNISDKKNQIAQLEMQGIQLNQKLKAIQDIIENGFSAPGDPERLLAIQEQIVVIAQKRKTLYKELEQEEDTEVTLG